MMCAPMRLVAAEGGVLPSCLTLEAMMYGSNLLSWNRHSLPGYAVHASYPLESLGKVNGNREE